MCKVGVQAQIPHLHSSDPSVPEPQSHLELHCHFAFISEFLSAPVFSPPPTCLQSQCARSWGSIADPAPRLQGAWHCAVSWKTDSSKKFRCCTWSNEGQLCPVPLHPVPSKKCPHLLPGEALSAFPSTSQLFPCTRL